MTASSEKRIHPNSLFTGSVFAQGTVPSMQEAKQAAQPKKEEAVTKKLEAKETKTTEVKEATAEKTKEGTAAPAKPAVKKHHKKHYAKPVEQKSPEAK